MSTAEQCLDCRTPFSFFFDFIGRYWKTPCPPGNDLTLHRLCTLARKQGATFVNVECALDRDDVREEIDMLDEYYGGGGDAEAVAIAFITGPKSTEDIVGVAADAAIGTAVLINYRKQGSTEFDHSYIYEAIVAPPHKLDGDGQRRALLNNYICRDGEFRRNIRGREFSVSGFYYCQQNNLTHVCAHACLRMAINSIDPNAPLMTSKAVNAQLNLVPPLTGLSVGQILEVIKTKTGTEPMVADCSAISKQDYLSILASFVESGCITLLVFTTANAMEHVVTVFGHTKNTDEWHPQAIPGYSGPQTAPFYPSSAWIDHFVIHDDNLGPYYTLSSRALEVDPTIRAHWIIGIHPHKAEVNPHYAESLGAIILRSSAANLAPQGSGKWFDYVTKNQRTHVMRAILMSRDTYKEHLCTSVAHDRSAFAAGELDVFDDLPDWFWMVEYSVPALFTGNRSKLGEVIIRTDNANISTPLDHVLGLRLPGLIVLRDKAGAFGATKNSLTAHSPIYIGRPHDNEW